MASAARPAVPAQQKPGAPEDAVSAGAAERVVAAIERRWGWALGGLLILDSVLLLYMGRGLSFFYDEWDFVTHDYGGGLHSLLAAHVGNISVFPVAVYKVLFHLVGLQHYVVYRLCVIALHLLIAGLIFVLAARRVPRVPALLATSLILFLGAAWEDLLWPFQIGYLLSIVGGVAAWVLLERSDRPGNVAAMLSLIVSIGSSSLGIPILIGVAVELACLRRWRRGWIVLVPAVLYLLWYLSDGESQITRASLINAPGFAADLAAAAFGALVGRALEWGRPLAVGGAVLVGVALTRTRATSPRLAGLLATGISLWIVTAAARSTISAPETSRYVYLGAVVIVLVAVELLSGVKISARATVVAAAFVALSVLTGLTVMHNGAEGLRSTSKTVTAELGALELAAQLAPPTFQPDTQRAPQIQAGPYLHTVRAIGSSPADSPAAIAASDAVSRAAADSVLVRLGVPRIAPLGSSRPSPLAPAPATVLLTGGAETQVHGCLDLTPLRGASMTGVFMLPSGGATIDNRGPVAVSIAVRRFGEALAPLPAPVPAHAAVALSIPPDSASTPWQLQITSGSPLAVCGLLA
jgi:hypothetical protein